MGYSSIISRQNSAMKTRVVWVVIILLATSALGWDPPKNDSYLYFLKSKYQYAEHLGVKQFVESLVDLGYKNDMIEIFNKTEIHELWFGFKRDGRGTIKVEITRVLGNIVRVSKDVEQGKEFEETLFDGRKSKTTMIFDHPDDYKAHLRLIKFKQNIEKGPSATTLVEEMGDGFCEVRTQVPGKSPKMYWLNLYGW